VFWFSGIFYLKFCRISDIKNRISIEILAKEEFNMDRILVTSGVGARDYYRKFGYRRRGVYMGKGL